MIAEEVRPKPVRRRRRRNPWIARRRALYDALWGADTADLAPPARYPRRWHALIIAAYALITALATWPLVARPADRIISDGGDALMNYWGYWWLREAIRTGQNPYVTPYLYAPDGAPLYLHTLNPINGLISLPFQVFGLTVAYNAVVFLSFVLAAYCACRLVAHVSGNLVAGFVGGIIFAFGSYHLTHLLGHTNLLTSAWIPLAALSFLRATETTGRRRTRFALATTGCLVLLVLADWQYVIFAALLIAALAAWLAVARRTLAPPLIAAASGLLLGVIALPLVLATVGEIRSGIVAPPDPGAAQTYSADLISFVVPAERHPLWGDWARAIRERTTAPPVEDDIFLGFLPLALGLWALAWDRRRALRWWAIGLAFAVLALGPILHVQGVSRWPNGDGTFRTIPLPYAVALDLPGLNFLRVPVRLSLMVTLALAVLGGIAVAQIARRWPTLRRPRLAVPLVALLTAALLFEHLAIPFPTEDTTVPQFYRDLAASPEPGTILEWPFSLKRARSNFYQTVHGRPIVGGYVARRLAYPLRAVPPLRALPDPATTIYAQPEGAANLAPWVLRWADVRWIVVYRDELPADSTDLATLRADYADGPPIYEDDALTVFRVRPPTGTATAILGGSGWYGPERLSDNKTNIQWFASSARFTVWHFGAAGAQYALRFDAWTFRQPRRLEVWLDGQRLGEWRVADTQRFDLPLTLADGMHEIELRALDPAVSPASVGYPGGDTRPLAFAISNVRLER